MQTRIIEIPLNKLVPSEANVRKTNRLAGVEELAANIAARGGRIIQSLAVQPVLNAQGEETGVYRVPAGGRRLAALKLLAKRKVIAKTAPIPCIVNEGDEEDVSLSENVMREPLHPADQFEAFKRRADRGEGEEEIAARFGVTPHVVRQRLRLAAISPALMQTYRDGGLTLDQLMAFTVTEDHERQEQIYSLLASNPQPYLIRRMLLETQVPARDRRARFVGADAYVSAGGSITRDLFTDDEGGWFSDPALLDQLASDKLEAIAVELREQEMWKWVKACVEYPQASGLGRLYPKPRNLGEEDQARLDSLSARYNTLVGECEGEDEISEDLSGELDALAAEINGLTVRKAEFDPEDITRAGAFVILCNDGAVRIERGFVRPEDEPMSEPTLTEGTVAAAEGMADEGVGRPLSDALVRELTAQRTMALRLALGENAETAQVALIHALALRTFYPTALGSCLDITPKCIALGVYAPRIEETAAGRGVELRHQAWAARVPKPARLWDFVAGLEDSERLALMAHCVSMTVFAVREAWDRSGRYVAASNLLAEATILDMSAYWKPTTASYFGRVTKAAIIEAVKEAVSVEAGELIAGLNKVAMAEAAETLMAGTAWLPLPLRTATNANGANTAARA